MSVEDLQLEYDQLLRREFSLSKNGSKESLEELRKLLLFKGLPENASDIGTCGIGSLRGTVWKALLGIGRVDVEYYVTLVRKGPSSDYEKIFNDVYRTFSQHKEYTSRVPRERLVRLLNAFVHERGNIRETYIQSMSVLAAPFLFLMPEPEAFVAFDVLLRERIPDYVFKYAGVHRGCNLLNRCLHSLDEELYQRLRKEKLTPQVYAFPNISSLGMCVLPLKDSMRLLDVQLAYGSYLGVFFSLGRLILARDKILRVTDRKPIITRDMETGLGVGSEEVLRCTMGFLSSIEDKLYEEVAQHTGEKTNRRSGQLLRTGGSAGLRSFVMRTAHSYMNSDNTVEDGSKDGSVRREGSQTSDLIEIGPDSEPLSKREDCD